MDRINRYCEETTRAMWSFALGLWNNWSTKKIYSSDSSNNDQNINMAITSSIGSEVVIDLTATNNTTLASERDHSRDPDLINFLSTRRRKRVPSTVVHEVEDDATPPKRCRCSPESQPYECPVCLNSVRKSDSVVTKCGHVFCKSCIEEAIKATHKCPMCNKKLTTRQISRIYL